MDDMNKIEWTGLYGKSWHGNLVPEAFSHPAKVSFGLAERIYDYMIAEGMIEPGAHIVDPFGGIAGFAFHAMASGLHWHGCELEPRFVELGNQNIGMWNGRYRGWMRQWGTAVLHRGDSRRLAEVVGVVDGMVSSPPFAEAETRNRSKFQDGEIASMMSRAYTQDKQGVTDGNLASMSSNDFDAAISSPPYADAINAETSGIDWEKAERPDRMKPSIGRHNTMTDGKTSYGRSPGQLGAMDAAVGSPPFEDSMVESGDKNYAHKFHGNQDDYGSALGNVGNDTGDTFWQAARVIVEQTYTILKPGAYAAWVTGDFVRKGKRVHFGQQWLDLCVACGFKPHVWAVAWKTESNGSQLDIFGGEVERRIDRVSFFRRLANAKNPDNAILNEDVIFVSKPV